MPPIVREPFAALERGVRPLLLIWQESCPATDAAAVDERPRADEQNLIARIIAPPEVALGHLACSLKPASPSVPAASAKEENKNNNDEKCLRIHVVQPLHCRLVR